MQTASPQRLPIIHGPTRVVVQPVRLHREDYAHVIDIFAHSRCTHLRIEAIDDPAAPAKLVTPPEGISQLAEVIQSLRVMADGPTVSIQLSDKSAMIEVNHDDGSDGFYEIGLATSLAKILDRHPAHRIARAWFGTSTAAAFVGAIACWEIREHGIIDGDNYQFFRIIAMCSALFYLCYFTFVQWYWRPFKMYNRSRDASRPSRSDWVKIIVGAIAAGICKVLFDALTRHATGR